MNTLKTVLQKFSKEKNNLKTQKIKLSMISEIEDALQRGFGSYDILQDAVSEAQQQMTKARDILKFEMNSALLDAEEFIDELENELKQLGVDEPAELKRFRSELSQLEKLVNKAEAEIRNVG